MGFNSAFKGLITQVVHSINNCFILSTDVGIFCSMNKLRAETAEADAVLKQKQLEEGPQAAFGYGGKFGVQADRFVLKLHGHTHFTRQIPMTDTRCCLCSRCRRVVDVPPVLWTCLLT
jgi:hypothetical protein